MKTKNKAPQQSTTTKQDFTDVYAAAYKEHTGEEMDTTKQKIFTVPHEIIIKHAIEADCVPDEIILGLRKMKRQFDKEEGPSQESIEKMIKGI